MRPYLELPSPTGTKLYPHSTHSQYSLSRVSQKNQSNRFTLLSKKWVSFKGKYLSDSIILCNQITKIFTLFFFFHYSSEFSVKDQQFSINLIQTLRKSATFQGTHYLCYSSISFFPRPIHWITENITKSNVTLNTKYFC